MNKLNSRGFTVLELLLVIVIVGIIGAVSFSRVEQSAQNTRNKEREGDVKTVQMAIEGYYAKTGEYPKVANLEDVTWIGQNLKGLDNSLLTDPKGIALNKVGGYNYSATKDGTVDCKAAEVKCGKYVLKATLEKKPVLELKSFN